MEDTQQEQVDVEDKDVSEEQTENSEPTDDGIQIPDDWEADVKDFVNSISDSAGKKAVFNKIKNLSDGYMTKYRDLASQRKQFDADKQAFDANKSLFDGYSGFDKSIDPQVRNSIIANYGSIAKSFHKSFFGRVVSNDDQFKTARKTTINPSRSKKD